MLSDEITEEVKEYVNESLSMAITLLCSESKKVEWIPDNAYSACMCCNSPFSLLNRRQYYRGVIVDILVIVDFVDFFYVVVAVISFSLWKNTQFDELYELYWEINM